MEPLQMGVSNYVPADSEKILFRLDTWSDTVDDVHGYQGLQSCSVMLSLRLVETYDQ